VSRATGELCLYGATAEESQQHEAFTSGHVPVAIYGLGKMGLPLAAVYADVCGNVVGADVDPDVVRTVNDGGCHVKREPGLADLVAETVECGALRAVADPTEAAAAAAVHVLIVPTLLTDDGRPDLSIVEAVTEDVAAGLEPGDLVVVESTVPPRTCADVVRPVLAAESGLDPDEFGVAFCPERTASGRALVDIRGAYPKIVGGVDGESTRAARLVYEEINEQGVIPVADATTAEAVKVFEGVYRDVNIALANELARFADEFGIDVREAIDVANTQPFCDLHEPGPGVGGHCIPVYPHFLVGGFETAAPLMRTARAVNDRMPEYAVDVICEALAREGREPDEATVAVFGLTYRPNVAELRNAPALPIVRGLDRLGSEVLAVDPLVEAEEAAPATLVGQDELDPDAVDVAVLVTPHDEFGAVDWNAFEVVVDGRAALDGDGLDATVYTIGDALE